MITDSLALLSLLSSLSERELKNLISFRFTSEPEMVEDPLEFADLLLNPKNIESALTKTTAADIAEMLRGSATKDLSKAGLATNQSGKYVPLNAVSETLQRVTAVSKKARDSSFHSISSEATDPFLAVQKMILVIQEVLHGNVTLKKSGAFTQSSMEKLGDKLELTAPELEAYVWLLEFTNIVRVTGRQHAVLSPAGAVWVFGDHAPRWVELGRLAIQNLPEFLSSTWKDDPTLKFGEIVATFSANYPLTQESDLKHLEHIGAALNAAGFLQEGVPSDVFSEMLQGNQTEAAQLSESLFIETVPGIIVQPDFTAVAPGPLKPAQALLLLDLSEIRHAGRSTTFVFTEERLRWALNNGWDATQILSFLESISLTPLPQPLTYLLRNLSDATGEHRAAWGSATQSFIGLKKLSPAQEQLNSPSNERGWIKRLAADLSVWLKDSPEIITRQFLALAAKSKTPVKLEFDKSSKHKTVVITPIHVSQNRLRAWTSSDTEVVMSLSRIKSVSLAG